MRTIHQMVRVGFVAAVAVLCACGGGGRAPTESGLVSITSTSVPDGVTGVDYVGRVEARFSHQPGAYLVTGGMLPYGLTLVQSSGALIGVPHETGQFSFEIAARDGWTRGLGGGTGGVNVETRRRFTMSVVEGALRVLDQELPTATLREEYSHAVDVAGGRKPYTFRVLSGELPLGISLDPSGVLLGVPSGATPSRVETRTFAVEVTDWRGATDTKSLSLVVVTRPLHIEPKLLLDAALAAPYDQPLSIASPGGGPPYVWAQKPPSADEVDLKSIGLEITPDGHVRTLPYIEGVYASTWPDAARFTATVTDSVGIVAERALSLFVHDGPAVHSITPSAATTSLPVVISGLNFRPGAKVIFRPGPGQSEVDPTFVNATSLALPSADQLPRPTPSGRVTVRVLNPDGRFADLPRGFRFPFENVAFGPSRFLPSAVSSTGIACADLDGDGKAEIVHCGASGIRAIEPDWSRPVSTADGLHLHRNNGDMTFTDVLLDDSPYFDVKIADVNLDGVSDIVALGKTRICTWLGLGRGEFVRGPESPFHWPWPTPPLLPPGRTGQASPVSGGELAVGFLNDDRIPDVVWGVSLCSPAAVTWQGDVYSMLGDGRGGFTRGDEALGAFTPTLLPYVAGVVSVGCLDVDGDGRSDVIAGTGWNWVPQYGVLFQHSVSASSGKFGPWLYPSAGVAPFDWGNTLAVVPADYFGDGRPAALLVHSQDVQDGGKVDVSIAWGPNLERRDILPPTPGLGKSAAAADFDDDGLSDFAVSVDRSRVSVYRGATRSILTTLDAAGGAAGQPFTGKIAFGDLDGDGRLDLVVCTSYWVLDFQGSWTYGMSSLRGLGVATNELNLDGDGSAQGVVFWLNQSN